VSEELLLGAARYIAQSPLKAAGYTVRFFGN